MTQLILLQNEILLICLKRKFGTWFNVITGSNEKGVQYLRNLSVLSSLVVARAQSVLNQFSDRYILLQKFLLYLCFFAFCLASLYLDTILQLVSREYWPECSRHDITEIGF